eukprot:gnl/Trimastix_PCT/1858.p1 GENE.gnl/Trimastix_PCT/1858~~gnl/Trimastix_PCT/1858.p1  ORF type:complete len:620 (-),score=231.32 gnl/Trimastix_PCT/1858:389-2248(-)
MAWRSQFLQDLEEAKRRFPITDVEYDGEATLLFVYSPPGHSFPLTIFLPESNYPRGEWTIMGDIGIDSVATGSIIEVISVFEKKFHKPAAASALRREDSVLSSQGEDDDMEERGGSEGFAVLQEELAVVRREFIEASHPLVDAVERAESAIVRLAIPLDFLTKFTAEAWRCQLRDPAVLEISLGSYYMLAVQPPPVTTAQIPYRDLAALDAPKHQYALAWAVRDRCAAFVRAHWPPRRIGLDEVMSFQHIPGSQRVAQAQAQPAASRARAVRTRDGRGIHARLLRDIVCVDEEGKVSFFAACLLFAERYFLECTSHCLICSRPLGFEGLRPAVCDNQLCVFQHLELGLAADLASSIEHEPLIVDMVISLCCAAATNSKRLDPFPTGICDTAEQIRLVLNAVPSIDQLARAVAQHANIKDFMQQTIASGMGDKAYNLLRWLIGSNRSHLLPIPEHLQFAKMRTPHQFILLSSPPEKERRFAEEREHHGSFLAFHGSSGENWHSILRRGLKNYSNTQFQSHGAAYGAGIYLAPNSNTAFSYVQARAGWQHSKFKGNLNCVALCEVINADPERYRAKPHHVIPEENHVATRVFFIYATQDRPSISAESLRDQLNRIMDYVNS